MSIIVKQPEKKKRELVPASTYPAYLYRIIDLGTQTRTFDGKAVSQPKIWLDFELPTQVVEYEDTETKEKKSFVQSLGGEYTMSFSEKGKLLPLIQSWLGRSLKGEELKSFDLSSLLGKPAFVSVSHNTAKNGNEYANISSVSPVMEGFPMPAAVHPVIEISQEKWGGKDFEELPDFLKEKIHESTEYRLQLTLDGKTEEKIPVIEPKKAAVVGDDGEEVPF